MSHRMRIVTAVLLMLVLTFTLVGTALADPSPNGPGQPGAQPGGGTTCGGPAGNANQTPGNAASAGGSVFNPNGTAGTVYAGNPGTASSANANSPHAISQYDIACFQNSQPHP